MSSLSYFLRKRPCSSCSTEYDSGAHYLQCALPYEVLLMLFGYFLEKDLCRLSQVCKKFRNAANDKVLWKRLYRSVFEYDLPLFHPEPRAFEFMKPEDSKYSNPWKKSFRELYHGVHVRAGQACRYNVKGRSILHFDDFFEAIEYAENHTSCSPSPLIFLHSGLYQLYFLIIDLNLAIIGAAPGDVAAAVVIEGLAGASLSYDTGADFAYCGYVTIRCNPDLGPYRPYCVEVNGNSSPTIDSCVIRHASADGTGVFVDYSRPVIKHCDISDCGDVGIRINDGRLGFYEGNKISGNGRAGIWTEISRQTFLADSLLLYAVIDKNHIYGNAGCGIYIRSGSNPLVRDNKIHNNYGQGIHIQDGGKGDIVGNEIYLNKLAGITVTTASIPRIKRNKIHSGEHVGVDFHHNGHGKLQDNEISNNSYAGVLISNGSKPNIFRNNICGSQSGGVLVEDGGRGKLELNKMYGNGTGVWIKTGANPTLKYNDIYDGSEAGVRITDGGKGILEDNWIFQNAQVGVLISTHSHPILRRNQISDGLGSGIEITRDATATLEYNELFRNKFGGLLLASGVTVRNNGTTIFRNRNVVEKAVKEGHCLHKISGKTKHLMHDYYQCITCNTPGGNSICTNCMKTCHARHQVVYVRRDRFLCDCGAGTLINQCKLTKDET